MLFVACHLLLARPGWRWCRWWGRGFGRVRALGVRGVLVWEKTRILLGLAALRGRLAAPPLDVEKETEQDHAGFLRAHHATRGHKQTNRQTDHRDIQTATLPRRAAAAARVADTKAGGNDLVTGMHTGEWTGVQCSTCCLGLVDCFSAWRLFWRLWRLCRMQLISRHLRVASRN